MKWMSKGGCLSSPDYPFQLLNPYLFLFFFLNWSKEVLITPKEFSIILAEDIDHPQAYKLVSEIEECIKTQCAAYVGAADEESPQEEYDGNELSSERIIIKVSDSI